MTEKSAVRLNCVVLRSVSQASKRAFMAFAVKLAWRRRANGGGGDKKGGDNIGGEGLATVCAAQSGASTVLWFLESFNAKGSQARRRWIEKLPPGCVCLSIL